MINAVQLNDKNRVKIRSRKSTKKADKNSFKIVLRKSTVPSGLSMGTILNTYCSLRAAEASESEVRKSKIP
jgi:Ribonuclease G/E